MKQSPKFFGVAQLRPTEDLGEKFTQNLPIGVWRKEVSRLIARRSRQPFANRLDSPGASMGFGF